MSVCTFLAADAPLPEVSPGQDYPLEIDLDTGEVYDGDADDNFCLSSFPGVSRYTDKSHAVQLHWRFTKGRGETLLRYIRENLQNTDALELWHVWLMDYWEYEDRPVIHRFSASVGELTPTDIWELDSAEIWNNRDKDRPSFYCLTITA